MCSIELFILAYFTQAANADEKSRLVTGLKASLKAQANWAGAISITTYKVIRI